MGLTGDVHLTPEELAARWHCSPLTLKDYRYKGGGPAYLKFGRRVLYPAAEVEAWEKAHMMAATTVRKEGV